MTGADRLAACIAAEALALGVILTPEAATVAGRHAEALLAWNPGANLTRVTEPEELARRHFGESFLVARVLPGAGATPLRVLDVGAGGGFPGLALRLVRPDISLVMLEPRRRKAAFLRHVSSFQPPPHPRVETLRLDELRDEAAFDAVMFRAVRLGARGLLRALAPRGRIVGFPGLEDRSLVTEMEDAGLVVVGEVPLPATGRRIVAWGRRDA